VNYVLITAARNEEAFVEHTLESVARQTISPERWVIVDDGSTDRTAAIVERYAARYRWIELVRRPAQAARSFAGKVNAFNAGLARVDPLRAELIGNIDADISFGPDHFQFLIERFAADPALGVAGTAYTEADWDSTDDSFESRTSVPGACQLFRRECFLDIGGYIANPAGGVDWIAVKTARLKGWKTESFRERRFHHYRRIGTAERSGVGAMFDYGVKDYFLGGSPLWEAFRVTYQLTKPPLLAGGVALMAGYCWAALRRTPRPVSPELVRFHRREQMARLRAIFGSLLRLKAGSLALEPNSEKNR
jgi:glycosyltransferase involved in cell wall biosynthesis